MQCISFDIITAPDLASGCRLYDLTDLDQHATTNAMLYKQRQQSGCEQLPMHLQRLVAVSIVIQQAGELTVVQLDDEDEAVLLQALFAQLDDESCRIYWQQQHVLAFLQLRALSWGIVLPSDWPIPNNPARRLLQCGWFDLQQMLLVQGNGSSLGELAAMLSLPSSMGNTTSLCREIESVESKVLLQQGALVNALHISLIYLRLAMIQGVLLRDEYQALIEKIGVQLRQSNNPALSRYADSWLGSH